MPVEKDVRLLPRRKIRYRLYRIKTNADNQVDSNDGLKKHYESQDQFDGWHNFAVTWDVGQDGEWPEGHFVAVPLRVPLSVQWQKTLLGLVEEPPEVEPDELCQGVKVDGDPCSNKADEYGYCYLHGDNRKLEAYDDSEDDLHGGDSEDD